jgi:hypothetical protein
MRSLKWVAVALVTVIISRGGAFAYGDPGGAALNRGKYATGITADIFSSQNKKPKKNDINEMHVDPALGVKHLIAQFGLTFMSTCVG